MIDLFHTQCDDEEVAAAEAVLRSGKLVLGEHVANLEIELGAYLGSRYVATCGSGTDALILAMEQMLEPGTEVIVPAMTFSATYEAVLRAGCRPVVVDVGDDLTLSPQSVINAITSRTSAVILVHLYGWPAADSIIIAEICRSRGIELIEDCAQAFGACLGDTMVGTFGSAAAFSFYPTKPLGGVGDGGAVAFRDIGRAIRAKAIRNHGRSSRGQTVPGFNSRLDEVSAVVLRLRLARYEQTLLKLRSIVSHYQRKGLKTFTGSPNARPAPYVYPFQSSRRAALQAKLTGAEIQTGIHYDPPVSGLPYAIEDCPMADMASRQVVSLPCHRGMEPWDVEKVCETVLTR